jgi:hypothetical protein
MAQGIWHTLGMEGIFLVLGKQHQQDKLDKQVE